MQSTGTIDENIANREHLCDERTVSDTDNKEAENGPVPCNKDPSEVAIALSAASPTSWHGNQVRTGAAQSIPRASSRGWREQRRTRDRSGCQREILWSHCPRKKCAGDALVWGKRDPHSPLRKQIPT
jgi:hypothetical protein